MKAGFNHGCKFFHSNETLYVRVLFKNPWFSKPVSVLGGVVGTVGGAAVGGLIGVVLLPPVFDIGAAVLGGMGGQHKGSRAGNWWSHAIEDTIIEKGKIVFLYWKKDFEFFTDNLSNTEVTIQILDSNKSCVKEYTVELSNKSEIKQKISVKFALDLANMNKLTLLICGSENAEQIQNTGISLRNENNL